MKYLLALFALLAVPAMAQVTLTASPLSGTGSVTPSLTWTAPAGSVCTASGGWSGAKAATGTQAVAAITATTTYGLSCVPPANGAARVSWNRPTQNTDGSALTDLAGYKLYRGASAAALTLATTIGDPAQLAQDYTGLDAGTYWFSITAFNAGGNESARAPAASKVIPPAAALTASVAVSLATVPNPPTGLTVTSIVAYAPMLYGNRLYLVRVGTVPMGTACDASIGAGGYYAVPKSAVRFSTYRRPAVVLARCA